MSAQIEIRNTARYLCDGDGRTRKVSARRQRALAVAYLSLVEPSGGFIQCHRCRRTGTRWELDTAACDRGDTCALPRGGTTE